LRSGRRAGRELGVEERQRLMHSLEIGSAIAQIRERVDTALALVAVWQPYRLSASRSC